MFTISNIKIDGSVMMRSGAVSSPPSGISGSLLFNGTADALITAASNDFNIAGNDFTMEWFQYMVSDNMFPRVFSLGEYSAASAAVSIEGGTMYFWANSGPRVIYTPLTSFIGMWTHIAIVRAGGVVTIYQDGVNVASEPYTDDVGDATSTFFLGSEGLGSTPNANTFFNGNLTNFRWSNNFARYTSNFTRPSAPLPIDSNTQLLLLASDDSHKFTDSTDNHSFTNVSGSNVTWVSDNPF